MKPISQLSPKEAQELLFFTSSNGTMVPMSKIESLSATTVTISGEQYSITPETFEALHAKLVTYEGVKLMYAQEDLAKQASKLTETSFASNFKEYFNHMDNIISHVEEQSTKVLNYLQASADKVSDAAKTSLENINSINATIKPFKQFAADTNLSDLKRTIKENVEQLSPVKSEFSDIVNHLKQLFDDSKTIA